MLVFRNEGTNRHGIWEWHPIARFRERVNQDESLLFKVVAEINLYLPDDWRLTKQFNNFTILVIPASGPNYKLAGRSHILNNGKILHVIRTVLESSYADQVTPQIGDAELLDDELHGRYAPPNLYFFQIPPDDMRSPLLARQYEKVLHNGPAVFGDTQFHRVHPLFKWGLDLIHFKWLGWNTNNDVRFVETPDNNYHGKDYWIVPPYPGNPNTLVDLYTNAISLHNITFPQPPQIPSTPYEHEYKMMVTTRRKLRESGSLLYEIIQNSGNFCATGPTTDKLQKDSYFDDADLTLYKSGVSFRFRKSVDSARVTLKVQQPGSKQTLKQGEYRRIEEEATIQPDQVDMLFRGDWLSVMPYRLIAYVSPHCQALHHVATVSTNRKVLIVENKYSQKAEICFDRAAFITLGGVEVAHDYEIEIESKGMPQNEVEELVLLLSVPLGLEISSESKYERAVRHLTLLP